MLQEERCLQFSDKIAAHPDGYFTLWALPKNTSHTRQGHRIFVIGEDVYNGIFGIKPPVYERDTLDQINNFRLAIELACETAFESIPETSQEKIIELERQHFPVWLSSRRISYFREREAEITLARRAG